MPSNFLIFDRIRAFAKQSRIYPSERLFQNEPDVSKLIGTNGATSDSSSSIIDQTTLQLNRLERYKDYDQMDEMGEISLALDLYADEASLVDPETKHPLVIKAKTKRIKKELEDLFYNILRWDAICRPIVRYLCKYGDMPLEVILSADRDSVSGVKFIDIYNFTRLETRHGDLVGFFYTDLMKSKPEFLHPWQVAHMRLSSFESKFHPYGRGVIEGGRKAFKQLRLMEDAALIYRITRAPERRKFIIPVGNIPPNQVPEYLQAISRNFKRQRFYNPTSGTFDERYSPLIQEDDIFLPRRADGSGPDVDILPGAENLDKIADIEYFKKKMIAPTKIPFARVGIGEGAGEGSEKSLSQSSSEFAKAIQYVQREVSSGLTKIAIIHLTVRGYSAEDIKSFSLHLPATSAMEELYRIETWQTRTSVMADLKDLGWFPKEWIVTHFTDLSPDEIEEIKNLAVDEEEGAGSSIGGGMGGAIGSPEAMGGDPMSNDPMSNDPMSGDSPDAGGPQGQTPSSQPQSILDGYDYGAESRLIKELKLLKDSNKRNKIALILKEKYDSKCVNSFSGMLLTNEFVGLKDVPSMDNDVLEILESIAKPDESNMIIEEYEKMYADSQAEQLDDSSATEIKPEDIESL